MKDTITAKFTIDANFDTVQAIRRALADDGQLVSLLSDTMQEYITEQVAGEIEITTDLTVPPERANKGGRNVRIPIAKNGILTWYDPDADRINTIATVGKRYWFEWLAGEGNTSFRYVSGNGATFSAHRRKNGLWYASKRLDGKWKRRYLGKADNLTVKKLDAVAFELAQRSIIVE